MLTLYHSNNSYAAQKVRLFLAENNIAWFGHLLNLLKQEHLTEEYKKINPRGLVPALDDDGKIIVNSTEIMEYLDEHYAPKKMDKKFAHEIHDFCKADEILHDPSLRTLSYYHLWMDKPASPEEIQRILPLAKAHPDKARGEFLTRAIQQQMTQEEVAEAHKAIVIALEAMEQQLSKQHHSDFFFGNDYTMADSAATVRLSRLYQLNLGSTVEQYPLTLDYYEKMRQRPSFTEAKLMAI